MDVFYQIQDVLAVAAVHPFYASSAKYPSCPEQIALKLKSANEHIGSERSVQTLLHKDKLYKTIERLYTDDNPQNCYRHSSYISITGGGSGKGVPMLFLTDVEENQKQRLAMSMLIKACKLIEPSDWVLNLHPSGLLYRALDLTTQIIEQAGGSVLCAGHVMPHETSFEACVIYRVNVITGDASHVLNFAHHVGSMPLNSRRQLNIKKIIYTCEMMSKPKRRYLISIFGPVLFFSLYASAETGPWAVADLSIKEDIESDDAVDFLYDSRAMKVEILSLDSKALDSTFELPPGETDFEKEGAAGHVILTSLQRLKNPLVRYVSGDVASLHTLQESSFSQIGPSIRPYLKILRLHGRDQRFSFKWLGEYFEFEKLKRIMEIAEWGILRWQAIIEYGKDWDGSDSLELRLMRRTEDGDILCEKDLLKCLHSVFFLTEHTRRLFKAIFIDDLSGFERSAQSTKIAQLIDKRI